MSILDSIKKGFGIASRNLLLILVLFIFNLIWNMINLAIMPAELLQAPGTAAPATPPTIPQGTAIAMIVSSVVFILLSILMQGGSLGSIRDYIKEGKMKLASFISYGFKYYLKLLGLGLLIILLVVIAALIAALIVAVTAPLNNVIATTIATIIAVTIGLAALYFVLLLIMSPYSIVCDGNGIIAAMKKSMAVVRKAFLRVLLLSIVIVLINLGIGVIIGIITGALTSAMPAKAGQIVMGVINSALNSYLGIVAITAFMTYYLALSGKEQKA